MDQNELIDKITKEVMARLNEQSKTQGKQETYPET